LSTVERSEAAQRETVTSMRELADQAFSRAAGASLVTGNSIRVLRDARENYPAWLESIARASRSVHFESYIIHDDDVGQQFARALIAKAGDGVRVRVIYDWLGGFGKTSVRFWDALRAGGVEVRCYNRPHLRSPFGWLSRDHRKMLTVDGMVGFVTGLCVGQAWVGDHVRGIPPWRDTGVEVRGPAVRRIEEAFAHMWALMGAPLPDDAVTRAPSTPAGDAALRIVATVPGTAGLFRMDQLVAALRPKAALAHRCLLRRHDRLRAGLEVGRARRRGCQVAGTEWNRHSFASTALTSRLSDLAGGWRASLRVERPHAARQDRSG
jgi:cardiolipin synthase